MDKNKWTKQRKEQRKKRTTDLPQLRELRRRRTGDGEREGFGDARRAKDEAAQRHRRRSSPVGGEEQLDERGHLAQRGVLGDDRYGKCDERGGDARRARDAALAPAQQRGDDARKQRLDKREVDGDQAAHYQIC